MVGQVLPDRFIYFFFMCDDYKYFISVKNRAKSLNRNLSFVAGPRLKKKSFFKTIS